MQNITTETYITSLHKQKNKSAYFLTIPNNIKSQVFLRLNKNIQKQVIQNLSDSMLLEMLKSLDPDQATDLLQFFDKNKQQSLLKELSEEIQQSISLLLKFDQKTAGGIMNLNYIQVDTEQNIADVAKQIKTHDIRTGRIPEILIIENGKPIGHLPIYKLGLTEPHEKIKYHIKPILTINHDARHKQVVETFESNPHDKIVVLDENKNALGIIYSDDVLRLIKNRPTQSLYDFAGLNAEEDINDPAVVKIRFRYKWLIINLLTAFLAAYTVSLFEDTIDRFVVLAVYMPIVAGMGGNAATQTLAVVVRGLALKQINLSNYFSALKSEIASGFVNGVINGFLVFLVAYYINKNLMLGIVLFIAMIVNLVVAAIFGTVIPLVMRSLKKDPASSATIFITTATDVIGFLAFLGLAAFLLK